MASILFVVTVDKPRFDELSNIVVKGANRYIYQDPDNVGHDQMRVEKVNDGSDHDYTYDADGSITVITNRFTSLSYDNLGKLRQIVGTQTDQYWYDHTGLRVKKTEDVGGTPVTTYTMFDGNNPLMQEIYQGSTRKAVWFQILVGEQILARVGKTYPSTATTLYFALDNLGSRRAVFDASGAVVDRYRYSAWGVATQDVGTDKLASFTAKDYDASGLLYFNARYYDSQTGRFLSEDPARKGSGWYSYCDGNPVNATDPTGLDPKPLSSLEQNRANPKPLSSLEQNRLDRSIGNREVARAEQLAAGGKGYDPPNSANLNRTGVVNSMDNPRFDCSGAQSAVANKGHNSTEELANPQVRARNYKDVSSNSEPGTWTSLRYIDPDSHRETGHTQMTVGNGLYFDSVAVPGGRQGPGFTSTSIEDYLKNSGIETVGPVVYMRPRN